MVMISRQGLNNNTNVRYLIDVVIMTITSMWRLFQIDEEHVLHYDIHQ